MKGKMFAHENVVGGKRKEKAPDVEAAGARKEKKHDKEKQKKHQDQMSLDTENEKQYRPARLKSFVGGNLKLKEKAPDEEVAGVRNQEKHKKHQVQMSLVTENEKDLAAGSKGKESDAHQETYCDDFLGKEVPVKEVEGKRGGCAVCGKWDHYNYRCPCLKYFRKGTEIGVQYETICRGCHRIGEVCCPKKGGYALLKECGYCYDIGHWEWEDCEQCSRPKDKVYKKPEFLSDKEEEDPESIIHPEIIFYPPSG
uniref:uncharacterized protein LOC101302603 isoform X2 n=1 Tax=Fragaria vesca subsp. vesca TaxID=101020 RepID=UPI0005C8DEE3|nr:PREDICTED: uncharacterized protein LOC101302603 isoform X2 [Fragaria vesca subsp. vesca]